MIKWRSSDLCDSNGVIVGADQNQEWLLPWWWSHYHTHNNYPVTFVDLGMTSEARRWCAEKGELASLESPLQFVAGKDEIDRAQIKRWEEVYGEIVWPLRSNWFKKPLAMLCSPYERTVWMDLDCEVLGSIHDLFQQCHPESGLALAKEPKQESSLLLPGETLYNSGVIAFTREAPPILQWAQNVFEDNHQFLGDQEILSRLIFTDQIKINELSADYNWRMSQGINLNAVIIHWVGTWGKLYIQKHGGLSRDLKEFFDGLF